MSWWVVGLTGKMLFRRQLQMFKIHSLNPQTNVIWPCFLAKDYYSILWPAYYYLSATGHIHWRTHDSCMAPEWSSRTHSQAVTHLTSNWPEKGEDIKWINRGFFLLMSVVENSELGTSFFSDQVNLTQSDLSDSSDSHKPYHISEWLVVFFFRKGSRNRIAFNSLYLVKVLVYYL